MNLEQLKKIDNPTTSDIFAFLKLHIEFTYIMIKDEANKINKIKEDMKKYGIELPYDVFDLRSLERYHAEVLDYLEVTNNE